METVIKYNNKAPRQPVSLINFLNHKEISFPLIINKLVNGVLSRYNIISLSSVKSTY
jgi:hypothetical protein